MNLRTIKCFFWLFYDRIASELITIFKLNNQLKIMAQMTQAYKDYKLLKKIGSGATAEVWKA